MPRGLFTDRKTVTSADLKNFATETLIMSSSIYYELRKEAIETCLIKLTGEDSWEAPELVTHRSQMPLLGT